MPEPEQQLFNEAFKIIDSFKGDPRDLEPWQHDILTRSTERLQRRILDIAFYGLLRLFDEHDPEVKRMWSVRFYYFLFEWVRWFNRHQKEQEIMAATKGWKQFEKEWSKYEATLTDEEKIPLWTKESFSYWFNNHVLLGYEEYVKRQKKKRSQT